MDQLSTCSGPRRLCRPGLLPRPAGKPPNTSIKGVAIGDKHALHFDIVEDCGVSPQCELTTAITAFRTHTSKIELKITHIV